MKILYKKPTLAWFNARKPYKNSKLNYDAQYFKVLEEMVVVIGRNVKNNIDVKIQYEMAYMLTGYLEDFLCEIGMWEAIRLKNKNLFGTSVPIFLNKSEEKVDYVEDDINLEDICLIIWYNLSQNSNEIFNSENASILKLANQILAIMNKHYDKLPATTFYDDFFKIKPNDDWGQLKWKLNWFAFNSPFVQMEANRKLNELNENSQHKSDEYAKIAPLMNHEDVLFRTGTRWHGQTINEMFADVCDADIKKLIIEFSKKDVAIYYLKNIDNTHFNFYNTYTNVQYLVPLESITQPTAPSCYYYAGFVKWNNNWEFNGVLFGGWTDHTMPDVLNEKFQHNFYYYVPEYQKMIDDSISEQHQTFKAAFGNDLAISKNDRDFLENLQKYDYYYYDRVVKDKSISKKDYVSKFGIASRAPELFPQYANLSMFFNKKAGIEYIYDLPSLIRLLQKKYEELKNSEVQELLSLIIEDTISVDFIMKLGENYDFKNLSKIFNLKTEQEFQFIMRYYKPHDFRVKPPMVSLSGICNGKWQLSKCI